MIIIIIVYYTIFGISVE